MKRAYIKNVFRTILNNKRRYLAILSIISLGIAFYVGLRSASPDMNLMINEYLDSQNMYDLRIITTLGVSDEDIGIIESTQGITAVMPAYYCDEFVHIRDRSYLVRFHSIDTAKIHDNKALNIPVLIEGNYPQNGDECLLDYRYFRMLRCNIGDYINVSTGNDTDIFDELKFDTYKVVGAVESPLYLTDSVGTSSKGAGYVSTFAYIPEESFNLDIYIEVYVKTDTEGLSRLSDKYKNKVDEIKTVLEKNVEASVNKRYRDLIDDGAKKIDEAKTEIADARKEIEDGLTELYKAQDELEQARAYETTLNEIAAYIAELERTIGANETPEAIKEGLGIELAHLYKEYAALYEQLEYTKAMRETVAEQIAKVEEQSKEAEEKFADAETEIAEHEEKLENLKKDSPHIYILDLDTNVGFVSFKGDSERIDALSYVFPFIFFLVAALVTLTNMMRIVEDDRSTVGVLKSLGYNKYYIFAKYIIYSVLVAIPGGVIGVLVGHNLFPSSIYNMGYRILYNTPKLTIAIHPNICILAVLLALASIIAPTVAVCYSEIVSSPADLIRPKAPRSGKRIILERIPLIWNRLSFFAKVTARNILRYKKRFFMTVAGIAGCTALLVTGFGIMDSIKYIPVKQFKNILLYDGSINLKRDITDSQKREVEELLESNDSKWLYIYNMTINAENNGRIEEVTMSVPQDITKVPEFFVFNSKSLGDKHKAFYLDDSGVIMTEKICSLLGYKAGDIVTLVSDNRRITAKLLGICENYVYNYVYITPELYGELFNAEPSEINYRTILCKTENNTEDKERDLSTQLLTLEGINGVSFNTRTINFYSDMINSLNFVVIILVLSAAALAFIVLFSLTAINIDERMRELATLKVLGFYNFETSKYIFRENVILTIIGTFAGLAMGIVLHRYVIETVEIDIVMFSKEILPVSFIYSAALTLLFSLTVNIAMNFSIKKINMVESLKSTE